MAEAASEQAPQLDAAAEAQAPASAEEAAPSEQLATGDAQTPAAAGASRGGAVAAAAGKLASSASAAANVAASLTRNVFQKGNAAAVAGLTAAFATGSAAAGVLKQGPGTSVPLLPRHELAERELVYRSRDFKKSSEALGRKFLAREVEAASNSTGVYGRVVKEVTAVKGDVTGLHGALGGLGLQVGGARLVAAQFAGWSEGGAVAAQ